MNIVSYDNLTEERKNTERTEKIKKTQKREGSVMISGLHIAIFYTYLLFVGLVKSVAPFRFFTLALI